MSMVNTLESKLDKSGGTILGDLTIKKNLTVENTLTINNNITQDNGTTTLDNINIYPFSNSKPQLKFGNTSYIIENEQGYLLLNQSPSYSDSTKKIATTEWVKIYPVPFAYKLVDSSKVGYNVGSDKNPIYFKDGIPTATGNMLDKDISGNASTATYATNAGHSTNSDEAINATKTDESDYSVSTDKFNKNGSITLTNAVVGTISFDGSGNIVLDTSLGSAQYGFRPNYNEIASVSSSYTATRPCWAKVYFWTDDTRVEYKVAIYSGGNLVYHNHIYTCWAEDNVKVAYSWFPLNTGDTITTTGDGSGYGIQVIYCI